MKKYISVSLLTIFIIPSIAFASWWNPFTWKIFSSNKKETIPQTQVINTNQTNSDIKKIIPVVKTSTIDKSKKVTPTVNTPKDNKAEIQAKLEADLKAKAEQDTLIAKQKADEQVKLEAEQRAKAKQDALSQLSINNIVIDSTENSAKISWGTNISSESKIILNGHEYMSENGVGTTHQVNINGLDSDSSFNGSITAIANNAWKNQDFQFTTKHSPLAFTYRDGSCDGHLNLCNFTWSTNNQSSGVVEVYILGNLVGSFNSESGISKTHRVKFNYIGGTLFKIKAVSSGESIETTVDINSHSA